MALLTGRLRGATRFEFIVSVVVWAILAGTLLHYTLLYRAEAERAGVRWKVEQIRSALLGRALQAELRGDKNALAALAGTNPVRLLQSMPPNYRGEFDHPEGEKIERGGWYFDRKQQILVYLFSGNKSFSGAMPNRWSYRIELVRLPTNNAKPPGTPGTITGVALHQVDG